jgi:site-specific DNA-methyltransferase (adenine-specific)
MTKRSTSTSAFGVSKRESHDASGFYSRFTPPALSSDSEVAGHRALDKLIVGDSRKMDEVPDSSVALVVTSPPYFAGKEYEESLGEGGVPATYLEYLDLLREVFAQCARKLEPGGRIAVNVANLGRRPYRSLSADVVGILQDDLRLLLRGEIVWVKQRGSSGSCAWGSFQRPGNPVLRDLSERVVIASKGRFDRALPAKVRAGRGLPSESSMTREDFMQNTLDVWEIPAESATRIGHPAPFPVELPGRLIELYTYRGDLVLDPFAGSGTTAVAALRAGRHFAGYDLDETYIELSEARVEEERQRLSSEIVAPLNVSIPAVADPADPNEDFQSRAVREGWAAKEIAREVIEAAGFTDIEKDQRQPGGVEVNFTARDSKGRLWLFDVTGSFTSHRSGLKRTDTLWKALGKAAVLREVAHGPLVLLTTGAPVRGSAGAEALKQLTGPKKPVHAVIEMLTQSGLDNLRCLFEGKSPKSPK